MDAITHFTESSLKKNVPELRAGDTVRVHQKIREGNKERIQIFEGTVLAVRGGKSINSSFVVRRIASGVGVEKTFPLHSPNVVKVERIKSSKVRQARLFYLRERFGRNARMRGESRLGQSFEEVNEADLVTEEAPAETEPAEELEKAETPEAAESTEASEEVKE